MTSRVEAVAVADTDVVAQVSRYLDALDFGELSVAPIRAAVRSVLDTVGRAIGGVCGSADNHPITDFVTATFRSDS